MGPKPLDRDRLYKRCDPGILSFASTDDLEPLAEPIGQERALEALRFGASIAHDGYNIFVIGLQGAAAKSTVQSALESLPAARTPDDWVYVNNFGDIHRPLAVRLAPGEAPRFAAAVASLADDLQAALPAVFASEDYTHKRHQIEEAYRKREFEALSALQADAEAAGLTLVRTEEGHRIHAVRDGEIVDAAAMAGLPAGERERLARIMGEMEVQLEQVLEALPVWANERDEEIEALNRQLTQFAVNELIAPVRRTFSDSPDALTHLGRIAEDVTANADLFVPGLSGGDEHGLLALLGLDDATGPDDVAIRYAVKVAITREPGSPPPVVLEDHPTFARLLGQVEHRAELGSVVTDVTLIEPGALHKAQGGFLLVDAERLYYQNPTAWEALKRALRDKLIRLESEAEFLSLAHAQTLEPQAIPLELKIVLVGEPWLFYSLHLDDPDFPDLFKVQAEFADDVARGPDADYAYARMLAAQARAADLRPFDSAAVGRLVEHSARLADDGEKLSLLMGPMTDLMREADHFAAEGESAIVRREHVRAAIDAQVQRAGYWRDWKREHVLRNIRFIDTEGSKLGQINGLGVFSLPTDRFGSPSRITARIRVAPGSQVVDIERQVNLGGPLHSKGVLILTSYFTAHYAINRPLAFAATLAFEQSYGPTDGDSASCAELLALLSALSGVPLRQDLAITGSVNQFGEVQPIGGANEKIEGFFDICAARGLTGTQGVVVPASNVTHLMLREDVMEAVDAGKFAVYAVSTVDEALEIFTGKKAGQRDKRGHFNKGSVNARVEAKLMQLYLSSRGPVQKAKRGFFGL